MTTNTKLQVISESEIWVGENKTVLIEGNIIYVIAVGEQTHDLALLQKQVNFKLTSRVNGPINYLIDLNRCGKNSPEARIIWKELGDMENTDRVAIFGLHPVARVLASFVTGIKKKDNQQFFSTKEEALSWLLKKKSES